jgi:hypothetical protein
MPQGSLSRPASSTNVRIRFPWPLRALLRTLGAVAPGPTADVLLARMLRTRRPPLRVVPVLAHGDRVELHLSDGVHAVARAVGSGPVIHLLHGWDGSAADWRTLAPAMVEAGYRVVVTEAPGHGEGAGSAAHVRWFAESLRAATDHFGAHGVVAHSFGAAATGIATAGGLSVARVVLLAPEPDPADWLRALASHGGPRLVAAMLGRMAEKLQRPADQVGLRHTLRRDALVIHDVGDRQVTFARSAAVFPSLLRTDGLGHRGVLHHPAVVGAVRSWLGGAAVTGCVHGFLPGTCAGCALERDLYEPHCRAA